MTQLVIIFAVAFIAPTILTVCFLKWKNRAKHKKRIESAQGSEVDVYGYEMKQYKSWIGRIGIRLRMCVSALLSRQFMIIRVNPALLEDKNVHLDIRTERYGMTDEMASAVLSGLLRHQRETLNHNVSVDELIQSINNESQQNN